MLDSFASLSTIAALSIGFLFGLKHATEVDHVVAVSTMVSEHRSIFRSATVGALWGIGHSASLLFTGLIVLSLRIAIPQQVSSWLELAVAVMIVTLGMSALWKSLRRRSELHLHRHSHDGVSHVHLHFHEDQTKHAPVERKAHNHQVSRIGLKPLLVGSVHGLAGSGALTLLILTQIKSMWIGLLYLAIFGVGSIAGMLLMSGLIGLPFVLSPRKFASVHQHLQTAAAVLSVAFGCWYAYEVTSSAGLL